MHKLTNRLDYAVGVDADHGHNVLVETDGSELVGVTELLEGAALTGFNNNLGNSRAETADCGPQPCLYGEYPEQPLR